MKSLIKRVLSISPYMVMNFLVAAIRSRSGKPNWYEIKYGPISGIKLWVNISRDDAFLQMINGEYDKFIYENKHIIKSKGRIIWDIGAHIGYHTLGFAKMVGSSGKVFAFEPNKANQTRLKLNLSGNKELSKNIKLMPFALGYKEGKFQFKTTDDVDSARSSGGYLTNILPPLESEVYQGFKYESVKVKTIDGLVKANKNSVPDIIKLDVEGAEADVIRGGLKMIREKHPIMLIEVHNIKVMKEIMEILIPLKYKISIENLPELTTSRAFIVCT